jgi:cysteine-rich repeat protein
LPFSKHDPFVEADTLMFKNCGIPRERRRDQRSKREALGDSSRRSRHLRFFQNPDLQNPGRSFIRNPIFVFLLAASFLVGDPVFSGGARGSLKSMNRGKRADIAHDHVRKHHRKLGLDLEDVDDFESREHDSKHNSTTHMNLQQRIRGIPINGAKMGLAVDRRGFVFGRWNDFVPRARTKVNRRRPALSTLEAVEFAASHLGLPEPVGIEILSQTPGPQSAVTLSGGNLSRDPIPAKLVYQPVGPRRPAHSLLGSRERLRLAWDLTIRTHDGRHWWSVQIDAENGELLAEADWISRETYRVAGPPPIQSPLDGPSSLVEPPLLLGSPVPSPLGWHDTDGLAGPEFTDTRGNNVHAQEDENADDQGGFRPDGGPGLVFDFPFDPNLDPSQYLAASVTSLFYWANLAHDLFYVYGFDEASGNFQLNNFGRGGDGGDPVVADAQDGAGLNNAQFGAPPDGFAGVMEMFIFSAPIGLQILTPPSIAGFFQAGSAEFGPAPPENPLEAEVVVALDAADGLGPSTTDGCTPLTNPGSVDGKIALLDRGSCNFTDKVINAENAGAIAVIVANNVGDGLLTMGGVAPSISIPSLFIGQSDGAAIRAEIGSLTASIGSSDRRDGSLDGGIILHEYGHGVTSRLTGGAASASCLSMAQSAGMGEGWSDFFTLFVGVAPSDTGADSRGVGTYVLGQEETGRGIRTQPYSTDMTINTLTLVDIETASPPHGIGEVWAVSLWEIFWQLANAYGLDSDIFTGFTGSGGSNLSLQLVMDGLKLQTCNPTFIEARDAILLAEANLTNEVNRCLLWRGFAKRGLGAGASVSSDPGLLTTSEDFSLPLDCNEFCADGSLAASEQCDDSNLIELDGCSSTCRVEESFLFQGIAQGGTIDFVVDGELISVLTLAGETATDVALKMADAIGANSILSGLGVLAHAVGDSVIVAGSITSSVILDPGLACGDGLIAPFEQCDDGNLADLDGCSSTCRVEDTFLFQGIAQGGTVVFVIDGQEVSIDTLAGETSGEIATKMASAIDSNPILSDLGVLAHTSGGNLVVAGSITSSVISDPGLALQLPLPGSLPPIVAFLLLASGALWLNFIQHGRDGRSIS